MPEAHANNICHIKNYKQKALHTGVQLDMMNRPDMTTRDIKTADSDDNFLSRIETGTAVILLLILLSLHMIVFLFSGALWRDEISSVNLIDVRSWESFWDKFRFDSFPVLWIVLLKAWNLIGLGKTDFALRTLGFIIGLGTLGAIWYAARSLELRLPLVSLVLFAMTPAALATDSLRAYGLGVLLILITLGSVWRAVQKPAAGRMLISLFSIILNVHSLYNNSFLVFAICAGAAAVFVYRRQWKLVFLPLGMGFIAAVSLLPYSGIIADVGKRNVISRFPVDLQWIFLKFRHALDPSGSVLVWLWAGLAILSFIIMISILIKPLKDTNVKQKELAVFSLVILTTGTAAYIAFIKILAYETQTWYYLPFMAVVILLMDTMIGVLCMEYRAAGILRLAVILSAAAFLLTFSFNDAQVRKTNMDQVAAKLETLADKNDLIIVYPFFYGISFDRYYQGSAAWTTLPEINDNKVQRFDLLMLRMTQRDPIGPVLQKITATLQAGHSVWLVGRWKVPLPEIAPAALPPAPASLYGWNSRAYVLIWVQQVIYQIRSQGYSIMPVPVQTPGPVSKFENVSLFVVSGF